MSYLPDGGVYALGPEKYLNQVAGLKKALSIPVIGSLNGVSKGGWTKYAKQIQDAGADALELNLYYIPTDPDLTAQELENAQVELVAEVKIRHHHSAGCENQSLYYSTAELCAQNCRSRRKWISAIQPLLSTRF